MEDCSLCIHCGDVAPHEGCFCDGYFVATLGISKEQYLESMVALRTEQEKQLAEPLLYPGDIYDALVNAVKSMKEAEAQIPSDAEGRTKVEQLAIRIWQRNHVEFAKEYQEDVAQADLDLQRFLRKEKVTPDDYATMSQKEKFEIHCKFNKTPARKKKNCLVKFSRPDLRCKELAANSRAMFVWYDKVRRRKYDALKKRRLVESMFAIDAILRPKNIRPMKRLGAFLDKAVHRVIRLSKYVYLIRAGDLERPQTIAPLLPASTVGDWKEEYATSPIASPTDMVFVEEQEDKKMTVQEMRTAFLNPDRKFTEDVRKMSWLQAASAVDAWSTQTLQRWDLECSRIAILGGYFSYPAARRVAQAILDGTATNPLIATIKEAPVRPTATSSSSSSQPPWWGLRPDIWAMFEYHPDTREKHLYCTIDPKTGLYVHRWRLEEVKALQMLDANPLGQLNAWAKVMARCPFCQASRTKPQIRNDAGICQDCSPKYNFIAVKPKRVKKPRVPRPRKIKKESSLDL